MKFYTDFTSLFSFSHTCSDILTAVNERNQRKYYESMVFQESLKVINKNNVSSIKSFDLCCHSATFLSSLFEMSKCPALHFSIFFYVRHTAPHLPTF